MKFFWKLPQISIIKKCASTCVIIHSPIQINKRQTNSQNCVQSLSQISFVFARKLTRFKVCSTNHRIWSQIYRNRNQIQFHLVWFQFCFDLVSNLKLKRNVFVNAVSEIRIYRIYFRLVSFFCESISKLKPDSGWNPNKSNSTFYAYFTYIRFPSVQSIFDSFFIVTEIM